MIVCPSCQRINPETAENCQACGNSLADFVYRACPACGALNPADRAFCSRCLTRLSVTEVDPADSETQVPSREQPADSDDDSRISEAPSASEQAAENERVDEQEHQDQDASETVLPQTMDDLDADHPLYGLEDLLPPVPLSFMPDDASAPAERVPTADEQQDAELLHQIATEPVPLSRVHREAEPAPGPILAHGTRVILYLLLLAAALVPFFSGDFSRSWVNPRPQVVALAEAMQDLPSDAQVLVAFDYAPGYSGELDPMAERVLTDLAQRSVAAIALSTRPEGAGLARQVFNQVGEAAPDYIYGTNYALLGYLGGQERGLYLATHELRAILTRDDLLYQPLERLPVLDGITNLGDFDALVLLVDDATAARRWIEQVGTRIDRPLHIISTAQVEPLLIPYLQSGQLASVVAGAYGAIEYPAMGETLFSPQLSADGYLLLFAVFLITALLANVQPRFRGIGS